MSENERTDPAEAPPETSETTPEAGSSPEPAAATATADAPDAASEPAAPEKKTGEAGEADEKKDDDDGTKVGWVQENIEAVVVAIVLAVIIRHFAMEAFVIPTGSMAPTLKGLHVDADCPNCGYDFAVAFPEPDEDGIWRDFQGIGRDAIRVTAACQKEGCGHVEERTIQSNEFHNGVAHVDCTECGEKVKVDQADRERTNPRIATILRPDCICGFAFDLGVTPSEVRGGNKILVNKFVYKFRDPRRFEVMVFKNPADPAKTFIKRVIGLPGETMVLRDGDVYVRRTRTVDGGEGGVSEETFDEIVTKPRHVQEILLQPVYDMSSVEERKGRTPPWDTYDQSWNVEKVVEGKIPISEFTRLECDAVGPRESWVDYSREIDDFYAYNSRDDFGGGSSRHTVGDLRVTLDVTMNGPEGGVMVEIREDDRSYRLFLRGTGPDELAQTALLIDGRAKTGTQNEALKLEAKRSYRVVLENIDDRVRASVDGKRVLSVETFPWGYIVPNDPDKTTTRDSGVRLGVRGDGAVFENVTIQRDVYYTTNGISRDVFDIGPDEFVVLGDNSPNSQDSRKWSKPGVPRSYIVGRAFTVFWPIFDFKMIK